MFICGPDYHDPSGSTTHVSLSAKSQRFCFTAFDVLRFYTTLTLVKPLLTSKALARRSEEFDKQITVDISTMVLQKTTFLLFPKMTLQALVLDGQYFPKRYFA